MASATLQVQAYHGSGAGTPQNAEAGVVWNRSDDEASTSRVPVPANVPGSNYSNYKMFRPSVTVAGTTTVSNLAIRKSTTEPVGGKYFSLTVPPASYAQCTGTSGAQGNRPADSSAPLASSPDPNTPTLYTVIGTSAAVYDGGAYATSGTGVFGLFLPVLFGLSHLYGGDPSAGASVPSLVFQYDES